jgi:hypothetical protein
MAEAAPSAAIAVTTVPAGRIEQYGPPTPCRPGPGYEAWRWRPGRPRFEQQAALEGCDFNASPTLSAAQMRD